MLFYSTSGGTSCVTELIVSRVVTLVDVNQQGCVAVFVCEGNSSCVECSTRNAIHPEALSSNTASLLDDSFFTTREHCMLEM
jgi:hypothetical protein